MSRIKPGEKVPQNWFKPLDEEIWPGGNLSGPEFYMVIVFRGVQCSHCKKQLIDFNSRMKEFYQRNIEVIAVSADTKERAERAKNDWGLTNLRIGYALSLEDARKMGLYISEANKDSEMPKFSEPGIFLIKPEQTLFAVWLASYPFARPQIDELLRCIDFSVERNQAPRGMA